MRHVWLAARLASAANLPVRREGPATAGGSADPEGYCMDSTIQKRAWQPHETRKRTSASLPPVLPRVANLIAAISSNAGKSCVREIHVCQLRRSRVSVRQRPGVCLPAGVLPTGRHVLLWPELLRWYCANAPLP